jgi:hypothetical protein
MSIPDPNDIHADAMSEGYEDDDHRRQARRERQQEWDEDRFAREREYEIEEILNKTKPQ